MAEKILKTKILLHRDSEANYGASTVYGKGEVCLVDTASRGLRVKVGDGNTVFSELPYTDEVLLEDIDAKVLSGYYLNGKFYKDSTYTSEKELPKYLNSIYIDRNTNVLYNYSGSVFVSVNDTLPLANENIAGIMKLYQTHGNNEDGAMSQKYVTDGVNSITFAIDPEESECLILDLPWD